MISIFSPIEAIGADVERSPHQAQGQCKGSALIAISSIENKGSVPFIKSMHLLAHLGSIQVNAIDALDVGEG